MKKRFEDKWLWVILITGLGFFSDMFDAFSYNVIRVPSLTELGLKGDDLTRAGMTILNCQVIGSVAGGFFWGLLGDKIGRKKALFGSIVVDSVAIILNGFVHDVEVYAVLRFFIGFGFAGEVGLGATLVAEALPRSKRMLGLALFTVFGLLGVVCAALGLEYLPSWRTLLIVAGVLGLLLLFLRTRLMESQLFTAINHKNNFFKPLKEIFSSGKSIARYVACIFILSPNFFITGFLLTLTPEIAKAAGITEPIKVNIILASYFAIAVLGDFLGFGLSHITQSRRKALITFILGISVLTGIFLYSGVVDSVHGFYTAAGIFGIFNVWSLASAVSVEQFPTHLRATVSTSVVNFARATVVIFNMSLLMLKTAGFGVIEAFGIIGAGITVISLISAYTMRETYDVELDKVKI